MDTREKILDWSNVGDLLNDGPWTVVPGLFDPLTATQAIRLSEAAQRGRKLLVLIDPNPDLLLPAAARAALIASLRSVAAVTIASQKQWKRLLPSYPDVQILNDEEGERRRSAEFVDFVLNRQQAVVRPLEKVL